MVLRFALLVLLLATPLAFAAGGDSGDDAAAAEQAGEVASPEEEALTTSLQVGSKARPLHTPPPPYPQGPRNRGQDGWVVLSFSVSPEGNVVDPIVEDSSGVVEFERAAIKSALKYRYSPATWNGKPVEQCAANLRVSFMVPGYRQSLRSSFKKSYLEAVDLVEEQRIVDAEARLDEMAEKGTWNNFESSKLWLLRATLQAAKGDKAGQLRSLRRAAMLDGQYIQPEYYPQVLSAIFALEAEQMHYGAALKTYAKLKKLKRTQAEIDKVVADIEQAIDGPDVLGFPGVVEFRSGCEEGRPNWKHELLRRKFTFDNIEGVVDDFELRCDWKRVVDKVSTEKVWEVPDNWGWCQLFVFGETGAKVKLIEYPLAESQRGIRREPLLSDLND